MASMQSGAWSMHRCWFFPLFTVKLACPAFAAGDYFSLHFRILQGLEDGVILKYEKTREVPESTN